MLKPVRGGGHALVMQRVRNIGWLLVARGMARGPILANCAQADIPSREGRVSVAGASERR
jgi:hypothetical protein